MFAKDLGIMKDLLKIFPKNEKAVISILKERNFDYLYLECGVDKEELSASVGGNLSLNSSQ